mgnify:FL=1
MWSFGKNFKGNFFSLVKWDLLKGSPKSNPQKKKQTIWHLNVPGKVKILACCACRNSLPSETNFVRGRVITNDKRDICQTHQEDVIHAL